MWVVNLGRFYVDPDSFWFNFETCLRPQKAPNILEIVIRKAPKPQDGMIGRMRNERRRKRNRRRGGPKRHKRKRKNAPKRHRR